jgi:hypothetical protein
MGGRGRLRRSRSPPVAVRFGSLPEYTMPVGGGQKTRSWRIESHVDTSEPPIWARQERQARWISYRRRTRYESPFGWPNVARRGFCSPCSWRGLSPSCRRRQRPAPWCQPGGTKALWKSSADQPLDPSTRRNGCGGTRALPGSTGVMRRVLTRKAAACSR